MARPPDQREVVGLFLEGVGALEEITGRFTGDDWDRAACGAWSATDTARHLLAVVRWYHRWLDRALAGDASTPFTADEMGGQNEAALADIEIESGPAAIDAFAESARAYVDRAGEHWSVPFGFPSGTVTVGLHCGVAATEWHLHAWDLSSVAGARHVPDDPRELFVAAGWCFAAADGGIKGSVLRRLVPVAARRSPWDALLARSGRTSP